MERKTKTCVTYDTLTYFKIMRGPRPNMKAPVRTGDLGSGTLRRRCPGTCQVSPGEQGRPDFSGFLSLLLESCSYIETYQYGQHSPSSDKRASLKGNKHMATIPRWLVKPPFSQISSGQSGVEGPNMLDLWAMFSKLSHYHMSKLLAIIKLLIPEPFKRRSR